MILKKNIIPSVVHYSNISYAYLLRVVRFFFFYSNSITRHMTFKSPNTMHLTPTPPPATRTLGQTHSRPRTNSRIWIWIWVWIGWITGTGRYWISGIIIITVTVIITGSCTMWCIIWICWITSWSIALTASAIVAVWCAYKSELASNIMYNNINCHFLWSHKLSHISINYFI